jgi:bacteriocin-like protein
MKDAEKCHTGLRELTNAELDQVSGGVNPHLTTITTNPGGVVNKSIEKNPNTETFTFKTTGKPS